MTAKLVAIENGGYITGDVEFTLSKATHLNESKINETKK